MNTPTTPPTTSGERLIAAGRDGTTIELDDRTLDALRSDIVGRVITRSDADYDVVRRVWNGMIDTQPAVIVACESTADVVTALGFARDQGLALSVRGGGHNAAGTALCPNGFVIDLSPMKQIELSADQRRVRAGGGVTIGELDAATQQHGLAVPLGLVTETGVGGLTLGGGLGWLRRLHGLSSDNLVGAEVVTADGRVVHASETEHADLLWGLRGGGGNLGVVTSFEFRAHPVGPEVFFAVVFHPADDIADSLRFYRDWASTAPDAISSMAVAWHGPAIDEIPAAHHHEPVLVFVAMYAGDPAEGEAALAPLREFGTPIADLSEVTTYLEAQQFFDEDYPKWVMRYYWTSAFLRELPDELIAELDRLNAEAPSHESTVDIWQLGGAMGRVPADATAFGDRSAAFMLGIEANWEDATHDAANIAWARQVREVTAPWATGTRYANFPGLYEHDEYPDFFGANAARLARAKAAYDPDGLLAPHLDITRGG